MAERLPIIVGSSKRCSGSGAHEIPGETCLRSSADSIRYICVSLVSGATVWQRITLGVSGITETGQVMIDSTIIRARQHSAGARREHRPQAIGRSRGGLTTKLDLAIDPAGRPLRMIITEGQVADISCVNELIENLPTKSVIADNDYEADALVQAIRAVGAKAVIPPRSNRVSKRRYSRTKYCTRNLVECFFNRIKHFRRVATRYDKLADSYLTFASLACVFGPVAKM